MNFFESVFKTAVDEGKIVINVDWDGDMKEIANDICCRTLMEIQNILDDDTLSDFECIEKIVCKMEDVNLQTGRHDF